MSILYSSHCDILQVVIVFISNKLLFLHMTEHLAPVKKLFFFRFFSLSTYFACVDGITLFPVGPAAIAADMLY